MVKLSMQKTKPVKTLCHTLNGPVKDVVLITFSLAILVQVLFNSITSTSRSETRRFKATTRRDDGMLVRTNLWPSHRRRTFAGPFEELSLVVQEVHIRGNIFNIPRIIASMFCEGAFRPVKHKTGLVIIKPGRRPQFAAVKTINETTRVKGSVDLCDAALQKPILEKRRCCVLLRNKKVLSVCIRQI